MGTFPGAPRRPQSHVHACRGSSIAVSGKAVSNNQHVDVCIVAWYSFARDFRIVAKHRCEFCGRLTMPGANRLKVSQTMLLRISGMVSQCWHWMLPMHSIACRGGGFGNYNLTKSNNFPASGRFRGLKIDHKGPRAMIPMPMHRYAL